MLNKKGNMTQMENEKKATVRDIAKKAGVSVATVSYVLNDKEGTKISDATRKKVLQVANLLNYKIPEKYKNTGTEKSTYSLGIIYSLLPDTPVRNEEILHLINLLAERFERLKFSCMLLPLEPNTDKYEPVQGLDGIIAIDLHEEDFKKMSGSYFVPVLCLDMMINDFLFYQIHTDFEKITHKAGKMLGEDYYLVTEGYCNEGYNKYISSVVPEDKIIMLNGAKNNRLPELKDKKLLVYGYQLAMIISHFTNSQSMIVVSDYDEPVPYMNNLCVIHNDLEKKANLAMNIMMNALEKKFDVKHEYKI